MENDDLFFLKNLSKLSSMEIELNSLIKKKWVKKIECININPEKYKIYINMIFDITEPTEGKKILDVGCGIGLEVIELANIGAQCIGLDAAEDNIKLINQIKNDFNLSVEGIHDNACSLPFEDETFDVVMSKEFFEHVIDIDIAMAEQIRVLKKGGTLIIEQSNLLNPRIVFDLLVKYPLRTQGKYGGIKWLFTKGKIIDNIYGTGWKGKDENIHTRPWWGKKMSQYPNLDNVEFTSFFAKRDNFRILEPLLGNIIIIARKQV